MIRLPISGCFLLSLMVGGFLCGGGGVPWLRRDSRGQSARSAEQALLVPRRVGDAPAVAHCSQAARLAAHFSPPVSCCGVRAARRIAMENGASFAADTY